LDLDGNEGESLLRLKLTSRINISSRPPKNSFHTAWTHNGSEDWAASLVRLGNAVAKLPPDFLGGE
jgi:hypothetical protein